MNHNRYMVTCLACILPLLLLWAGIQCNFNSAGAPASQENRNLESPLGPTCAGSVITRKIYLSYLSSTNVSMKDTIVLSGYVFRNASGGGWEPAPNDPIALFVDGVEITPANTTDAYGNISLWYVIPTDWDITIQHEISADLPGTSSLNAIVYNSPLTFNVYTDSQLTPDATLFAGHYLVGDTVTIAGKLSSFTVPTHNIVGKVVTITRNGAPVTVTTIAGGAFTTTWTINAPDPMITFDFAGVTNDYLPNSTSRALDTMLPGEVNVIMDQSFPLQTFEQSPLTISGTLIFTPDSTPLANRRVLVTLLNTTAEVTSNAQGKFSAIITVPNGVTTGDLNFTLLYADGTPSALEKIIVDAVTVGSLYDPGNPSNPIPYGLIVGAIVAVAAIIVILMLIRKGVIKLKRARPVYEADQQTLMDRADALAKMGRIPEAMAYLLLKYLDALRFRMQMIKKRGQTVRDIATEAVLRHLHQAEILYPWTSFVEAAVYSGRTVTTSDLEQAKQYFQAAQQVVPISEQELVSAKPMVEPQTLPTVKPAKPAALKSSTPKEGASNGSG